MKRLLENFKEQLLDPKVSDERASNLSGFITSGYECGCDNRWRMERYYREIIYKVEMFRAMLTKDETERLPVVPVHSDLTHVIDKSDRTSCSGRNRTRIVAHLDQFDADVINGVKSLASREIIRIKDFAEIAENPFESDALISDIQSAYNLDIDREGDGYV